MAYFDGEDDMKTTWALRAALPVLLSVAAPFAASGQEAEKKPAGPPQATAPSPAKPADDQTITLSIKPPSPRSKAQILRLEGTAQMNDDVMMMFNLHRMEEMYAGGRLDIQYLNTGMARAKIDSKKFVADQNVDAFGAYLINAVFVEEYQKPAILEATKGKYTGKQWSFKVAGWSDDHLKELPEKLLDMDVLSNEALELLKKFEKASASQQTWLAEEKSLTLELAKYLVRIQRSDSRIFFSATNNQIFFTMRNVQGTSPYFVWKDGQFAGGKSYHSEGEEIKTFRNEGFTYDNLKKYVSEGPTLAGREFCLWLIKDIRRLGTLKPSLAEGLKQHAEHPGVAPYAERLKTALPADCDELEKAIRQK